MTTPIKFRKCNDCRAEPGQPHGENCDVARCMRTGQQRIQCGECCHCETCTCPSCPLDIWTGQWPGTAEAIEFGWYCHWGPDYGQKGWVRCEPDAPGAMPDFNRLASEGVWNPETQRWDRR